MLHVEHPLAVALSKGKAAGEEGNAAAVCTMEEGAKAVKEEQNESSAGSHPHECKHVGFSMHSAPPHATDVGVTVAPAAVPSPKQFWQNLRDALPPLPAVQVEFEDVSFFAKVPLQAAGVANLGNTLTGLLNPNKVRSKTKAIVSHCSGVLEPGTITLLLGPSGHGKSTLMKIISGRIPTGSFDGNVWYGGKPSDEVNVNRLVSYVDQRDNHVPLLTVEETMKFSLHCMEDPKLLHPTSPLIAGATADDVTGKVRNLLRIFGLENAARTIVGDNLIRGVSGGEKKRVTLAEMMMGNPRVLLLDDISTGLDSSTTKDIIAACKTGCQELGITCLVSLLQPPPEVFALFDRVMLLREGRIVYHGPQALVSQYFAEMGIPCPDDTDPADFFVDFLSDPELVWSRFLQRERDAKGDAEYRPALTPPLTTEDLVLHFHAFMHKEDWAIFSAQSRRNSLAGEGTPRMDEYKLTTPSDIIPSGVASARGPPATGKTQNVLHSHSVMHRSQLLEIEDPASKKLFEDNYTLSTWAQFKAVIARESMLLRRNKQFIRSHILNDIIMGLIVGSLFFDLHRTSYQIRYGLFFLAMIHVMFASLAEVPIVFNMKRVVNKHAHARFYSVASYVFAVTIVSIPLAALDATIFSAIVYWMTNFDPSFARFCFFVLIIFLVGITFSSFFRVIAVVSPSLDFSQAASAPVAGLVVMFAGFLVTRQKILIWLQWVYWLSPFSWSIRSVALNEFNAHSYDFNVSTPSGLMRAGHWYLEAYEFQTEFKWKWAGVGYLLGVFVVTIGLAIVALQYWVKDDIRTVPYIEDPERRVAPTHRRRMSWQEDEGEAPAVVQVAKGNSKRHSAGAGARKVTTVSVGGGKLDMAAVINAMPKVEPVTLVFRDLSYDVQVKGGSKRLLNGVTGYALPGTLTALMGASGAGKTTLLDVISGRKTGGTVSGDILVNGAPKDSDTFPKFTGYVEQADIHDAFTTVREGLTFSAKLRMAKRLPEAELNEFISNLIHMLELDHVADWLVGSEETGIPRGERKRYTIGVELVTNPSVLFLDEPTSGLDSREAASVMRVIHRITKNGRTVIATIHQPAAELVFNFDQLLLLRRGGDVVYFGSIRDRAKPMVKYLEAVSGSTLPRQTNPANWMLDVLNKQAPGCRQDVDFAEEFKASTLFTDLIASLGNILANGVAPDPNKVWRDPLSAWEQFVIVFKRTANDYWRDLAYNLARFVAITALGVFLGLVFYNLPDHSLSGVQSKVSSLFMVGLFIGIIAINTSIAPAFHLREAFYREQAAKAYSPWAYSVSLAILEIPYCIGLTLPGGTIFYFMAGMKADGATWIQFQLALAAGALAFNCMGHFLAAVVPTAEAAMLIVGGVFTLTNIFCGLYIPRPSIPNGWIWLYWMNPAAHMSAAIVTPQFHCVGDCSVCPCVSMNGVEMTVIQYVETFLGHSYDKRWLFTLSTFLISVGFRIGAMLGLRYINHLKR